MASVQNNLNNSFFATKYTAYHRAQAVNQYGENNLTEAAFTVHASIQPTGGKELEILADMAITGESVNVYSREMLTSNASGGYSDIVIYDGQRYQVVKAKKYATHCESIAVLEPLSE